MNISKLFSNGGNAGNGRCPFLTEVFIRQVLKLPVNVCPGSKAHRVLYVQIYNTTTINTHKPIITMHKKKRTIAALP